MRAVIEPQALRSDAHQPRTYAAGLAGLHGVTLEDLNTQAARQTRVDRKYLVYASLLPRLLDCVAGEAKVLDIAGQREFGYRSVYLDDDSFSCFLAAGRNQRRRVKVRTRTYLDSGSAFLEVKTPGPRGVTVKERIPLTGNENAPLDDDGLAFVAAQLRAGALAPHLLERLRPTLATAYRRSTLVMGEGTHDAHRVTIDTNMTWTALTGTPRSMERSALAVIETKAGSTPTPVDRLLWRHGQRPIRMSKYGIGLAALTPTIPPLKWHCTLKTHFHPDASPSLKDLS